MDSSTLYPKCLRAKLKGNVEGKLALCVLLYIFVRDAKETLSNLLRNLHAKVSQKKINRFFRILLVGKNFLATRNN